MVYLALSRVFDQRVREAFSSVKNLRVNMFKKHLEQPFAEDTAKIEALRQANSLGIMDLEHKRFAQLNEEDLEHYLDILSQEATLPSV